MEMNNLDTHAYLVLIALAISFLLIGYDIQKVYAQAVITIITPTGGGFNPATADCTDITAGNDVAWINCNDTAKLYAIGDSTGIVLANITTSAAGNQLLACLADTSCVYLNDPTANRVSKYQLAGNNIALQGFWNSGCNSDSRFIYDTAGFIWLTCSATDQIIRMNPNTLATDTLASTGATCVSPDFVSYSPLDNIGIVHCLNGGAADTIISFSRTSSTAISVLDTETTTTGTQGIFIDGAHNIILAPTTSVMSVWVYTAGGALTLSQSLTGQTIDQCHIEPYSVSLSTQVLYAFCVAYSAPDTIMKAFLINSTGVFDIFSGASAFTDANAVGLDVHDGSSSLPVWYISSSTNNGKYIRIEGIRSLTTTTPTPAEPPAGGGTTTGIDCTLPENENILTCRLGGDGTIGGAGAFIVGDGSEGTGVSGILCSLGFVDCSVNDDVKTNGIGYLIFIAGIALMFGLFWMITKGHIGEIPTFIWIISILGLAGAFALFNIIDPVVFIITIVAVIALAVPKIISTVRGDAGTLGAGNTS